ncbi:MAG: methyltransferase domain-containing protein [Campylobacterales bacterium]|nr:methyltransferase domain-containing protein [Campylobacterales bacterium]
MKVAREFSRFASQYGRYNLIQDQVANKLVLDTVLKPKRILDLGCGSGAIVKRLDWEIECFVGIDLAEGMLAEHPKRDRVECLLGDFNDFEWLGGLASWRFEHIYSASALQWATDIDGLLALLKTFKAPLSLGIFTCNTFKTLYETAGIPPLLRSADALIQSVKEVFDARLELVQYTLAFECKQDLFGYIKCSGVSGGRNLLGYRDTKRLMREYPSLTLEFEVLFIYTD